jgi:hypothetical protein
MICARSVIIGLTALAFAASAAAAKPVASTDSLREQARERLKDPAAGQFSNERLHPVADSTGMALCGTVNAKNSYGGYIGKAGFVSTTEGLVVFETSEPRGAFKPIWDTWCR